MNAHHIDTMINDDCLNILPQISAASITLS